jgi:hypothetical protein
MAEVDLDLAEVFALFEQVGRVGMAQRVDMSAFSDAAGLEGEAEGALERGALNRLGGGRRAFAVVAFAGKEQRRMTVSFPEFAQEPERAFWEGNVAVASALAGADVEETPLGIDVAHFQVQGFAQAQAAGIDGGQGDALIQGGHGRENAAHLGSGEHDGQFELGIGSDQLEFGGPGALEGFFPEELEGADDLGGGLAGELFFVFEVEAVLTELFGRNQVGGFGEVVADVAEGVVVGGFGAGADGQQGQVVSEGV